MPTPMKYSFNHTVPKPDNTTVFSPGDVATEEEIGGEKIVGHLLASGAITNIGSGPAPILPKPGHTTVEDLTKALAEEQEARRKAETKSEQVEMENKRLSDLIENSEEVEEVPEEANEESESSEEKSKKDDLEGKTYAELQAIATELKIKPPKWHKSG